MSSRRPLPLHRSYLPCSVQACSQPRVQGSASRFCARHRYARKVHGDPLQAPLRLPAIHAMAAQVRRVYSRLSPSKRAELPRVAHRYCKPFHDFLLSCANGTSELGDSRWAREPAERLVRVFNDAAPLEVLTRCTALFLLRERQPYLFASDRAFQFQFVRGVRKLSSVADGTFWNSRAQRVQPVVKEIPQRVQVTMASWLIEWSATWATSIVEIAEKQTQRDRARAVLASELFADVREKVNREHAKAERKLAIARSLQHGTDS